MQQLSTDHHVGVYKSHKQEVSLEIDFYVHAVLDAFLNINVNHCFYTAMS